MKKLYGWDYFKKLEQNKPRIGRSINDTVTMLNAKESVVAAGPSATTLESRAKGNPVAVVYPEDGAVLMVSPSGILKNAPAPNAGQALHGVPARPGRQRDHGAAVPGPGEQARQARCRAARRSPRSRRSAPPTAEIEKGIPEVKELFRETFGI